MKQFLFLMLISFTLLLSACSEEDSVINPEPDPDSKQALIISAENGMGNGGMYELGLALYKDKVLTILSDIFQVEKKKMENMSLSEIIDVYGEEWQANSLKELAQGHYDEIVILTDETCTKDNLIKHLERLNPHYNIDMIFCLHGGEDVILFDDGTYSLSGLTDELKDKDIKIRMLYQTNCHSKYSFPYWAKTDIVAMNGAEAGNSITMISPQYFLENWINGMAFKDAVNDAYNREIEKIKSYSDELPIINDLLVEENLTGSKQYFGGTNPVITIDFVQTKKLQNYLTKK